MKKVLKINLVGAIFFLLICIMGGQDYVMADNYPETVTIVGAVNGVDGITINWKAANGAKTYIVYRKSGSGNWYPVETKATGTSYVDKTCTEGTKYVYTVRGENEAGLSPSFDAKGVSAVRTKVSVPETVTLVSAVNGVDGITINWKAANGAKTYIVYRKSGSGNWYPVETKATGTSYVDKTCTEGTKYVYTVRGENEAGLSPSFDAKGISIIRKMIINQEEWETPIL